MHFSLTKIRTQQLKFVLITYLCNVLLTKRAQCVRDQTKYFQVLQSKPCEAPVWVEISSSLGQDHTWSYKWWLDQTGLDLGWPYQPPTPKNLWANVLATKVWEKPNDKFTTRPTWTKRQKPRAFSLNRLKTFQLKKASQLFFPFFLSKKLRTATSWYEDEK